MPVFKLLPACKDYLWGGTRLKSDFGIQSDLDPLSEAWVLSCHPDGPSVLADGPYAGLTLPQYIQEAGPGVLGTNCRQFESFPLLIKLIDAKQNLSVQVHPSDEYALAREGQYGKTEMWVVLDAAPGAYLYCGFEQKVTREKFAAHIADGTLSSLLHKRMVQKGDVVFIPAGTLHAIGAGLVIAEIQQNSNVTYRVFDYGRVGADGKPRALHVEKALEVTDLHPASSMDFGPHLGSYRYFTTDRHTGAHTGLCGADSFRAILVTEGSGMLDCGGECREMQKGECWFLPADSGAYQISGQCEYLVVYIS